MIVKVHPWRITWRFLVVYFVIALALLASTSTVFFEIDFANGVFTPKEMGANQIIIIVFLVVLFVGLYVPSLLFFYYKIEKDYFVMKRLGTEFIFNYQNIEFIDIETSKKKKMVIFYSSKAKMRYLLGDKNGVLLKTIIKKCPNTMSISEFRQKHPEERY